MCQAPHVVELPGALFGVNCRMCLPFIKATVEFQKENPASLFWSLMGPLLLWGH